MIIALAKEIKKDLIIKKSLFFKGRIIDYASISVSSILLLIFSDFLLASAFSIAAISATVASPLIILIALIRVGYFHACDMAEHLFCFVVHGKPGLSESGFVAAL